MVYRPTRRELFEIFRSEKGASHLDRTNNVIGHVTTQISSSTDDGKREKIKDVVQRLCYAFSDKWTASKRNFQALEKKHKDWLDGEIDLFPVETKAPTCCTGGRPISNFSDVSDRSKRRKVESLRKNSVQELTFAAAMNARAGGNEDAAKILMDLCRAPDSATNMREALTGQNAAKPVVNFSENEALSLFLHLGISKAKYIDLRLRMKEKNAGALPSYQKVESAMQKCCPIDVSSITVTESSAVVSLQALLDHTATRLLLDDAVLLALRELSSVNGSLGLTLTSKWGFDGSSGHSQYKQKTESDSDDSSILLTSLVPLQICCPGNGRNESTVFWHNTKSSSTRYCRPISFDFVKETSDLSRAVCQKIEESIEALTPTSVQISADVTVLVTHSLVPCMVDGKVCSAIASMHTSRCNVCGACPSEMNNLDAVIKKVENRELFKFGLSPLHARIRFLEFILHLAYKLEIKVSRVSTPAHKESVAKRKKEIQGRFWNEMGLRVDVVKQGFGTTNDGNTARRVFANPQKTSDITGIDLNFIIMIALILSVLACGKAIAVDKFRRYALDTAYHYVSLYKWYYMPPSVHKILIHGPSIIAAVPLPIGMLSEEAQECRNKDLRDYRKNHTRKNSRISANRDLIKRLLVSSDPVISGIRQPKDQETVISDEMKLLLESF